MSKRSATIRFLRCEFAIFLIPLPVQRVELDVWLNARQTYFRLVKVDVFTDLPTSVRTSYAEPSGQVWSTEVEHTNKLVFTSSESTLLLTVNYVCYYNNYCFLEEEKQVGTL